MKRVLPAVGLFLLAGGVLIESIARSTAEAMEARAVITMAETTRTMAISQMALSLAVVAVIFALLGGGLVYVVLILRRLGQRRREGVGARVPLHSNCRCSVQPAVDPSSRPLLMRTPDGGWRVVGTAPASQIQALAMPVIDEDDVEDQLFRGWGFDA